VDKTNPAPTIPSIKFSWADVPRSIWYFLNKDRGRWLWLNSVLLVVLFYDIVPPLILGKIVDFFAHYTSGASLQKFFVYAIFLGVSHSVVSYIRLYSKNSLSRIAISARTRARIYGFERLVSLPLHWHAQENTGNKIDRVFTGSQSILEWTRVANNSIFPVVITITGILGAFIFLDPIFLVLLLSYIGVFFWLERHYNTRIATLSSQINIFRQKASGTYIEGSGNILAIKALGAGQGMQSQVKETEEQAQKLMLERSLANTKKWYFIQTLSGVSYTVFALLIGWQVVHGVISLGYILVFFAYFNRLRDATSDTTELTGRLIEMRADLASLMPIFRDVTDMQTGHASFPTNNYDVVMDQASFSYPSGQVGLSNLDFSLRQGESVGVAGHSGGGKSTLVKILLGLYPINAGRFTVGRQSYYDIAHEDLIQHVSVVLQETELFNFSLQENITLFREVDQEKLEEAVRISQLDGVIQKLPNGLQTLIGERGYKLSGGERQRLGIARAIYKDSPILILDEATSSLDSETEKRILDVLLDTFAHHKTILIIAHRISTLQRTDRVVVIDGGTIVEQGTYADLMMKPSSRLATLQAMQAGKG